MNAIKQLTLTHTSQVLDIVRKPLHDPVKCLTDKHAEPIIDAVYSEMNSAKNLPYIYALAKKLKQTDGVESKTMVSVGVCAHFEERLDKRGRASLADITHDDFQRSRQSNSLCTFISGMLKSGND